MIASKVFFKYRGLFLIFCSAILTMEIEIQAASNQPQPANIIQAPGKTGLPEDQARMIVKEIPNVDIKSTISRWKLEEPELARLREWSALLVQDPGRSDFLPQWGELITKLKTRNPALQSSDVASLIQMIMLAAYEEANKDLDSCVQKVKFYHEVQERLGEHLTEARQLQVLLRTQQNDPLAGSLIRLPANQRLLHRCQVQTGSALKLDCKEGLVSTTMELESYLTESEAQIQNAEEIAQQASLDLQKKQPRRIERLEALSRNSRAMFDMATTSLRKTRR